MNTRMDRSRINIGTYCLQPYARTEEHIRDLRDCGIDFVIGSESTDRATLDFMEKYDVGCIIADVVPGWWGGDGTRAGKMNEYNPMEHYEAGAAAFEDHPAIWGIDIGDEPSALDFPYYGRVYSKTNALFPHQFPYLNLYPNYASVAQNNDAETYSQLGTSTYAEHIEAYCRHVPADYLCYDFYVYNCRVPKMYENLCTVADACRDTGRSMWIVLQVNSYNPKVFVSENELRFQAYTAMAFGAEVITWACWTAGWWSNQVLDDKGEKTEQYDKLKTVNTEIHALSEMYMKYRRTRTHFVGFADTPWLDPAIQPSEAWADCGVFRAIRATDDQPVVIGEMVGRADGAKRALFVAAADDPYDEHPQTRTVTFTVDAERTVAAYGGNGRVPVIRNANGLCTVEIPPCGGVLITA